MSPVTGVMEQPALPGQPVEIGNDGRVNAGLLPNNYDPCINVVADEAIQAGDLCYLVNIAGVRKIRKASALSRTSLSTLFVKNTYAAGDPAVAYIHGVMVIPNPGTYQESDTGASLYLHEAIPGYVQKDAPNNPTAWIQRVAIITDVTPTEVRCFYIGFLDRGKSPGSSVIDTDPLVMAHLADMANPHQTTAAQVGALALALLGAADGVAGLDSDARVPEVNLPLTQWKRLPVRVAVTTNVTINAPGAALDGVTLASNDRVLLLGQTAPAANGIYTWNGAGVPMTRALDADNGTEVWNGIWTVREGSHAGSGWLNTNASTPTLGTTGLTFTRVIGTPAFTNPMTTQGDLIVGMSNGTPTRLPGGLEGQVMTMVAGVPTWQTIVTTGMANPMTAYGDMIYGGAGGTGERIAVGSNGQVLTVAAGRPQWVAPSTGMPNPLVDPYDILMADSGGNPSRLGTGTNGHVLTMVSGRPQWQAIVFTGMTNPMSASGDLIVGGALGAAQRLAKGSNGQVLTLVAGMPAWQAPDTGFTNPMTTLGDLLVGAAGGQASRLGIGTNGQVLMVVAGQPAWAAGMSNPMTTQGDLVIGNTGGAPMRLAKGANGQVLTLVSGAPAWAAPATGFTSPMTSVGDLIVGGSSGAPLRLGIGTNGYVLTVVAGAPAWQALPGSMTNPMTAVGDLIIGGTDGAATRLAKGTDGHVLTLVAGVPAWASSPAGFSNPMTTAGDLIVGGSGGTGQRLAKGTDGQVLKMVAGAPMWATDATGLTNPMSDTGDLIIGGTSGAPTRLAKGANGQVLKLVAGVPAWADESGGGGGLTNPMTDAGDIIIGGSGGAALRKGIGLTGQVLTVVAGVPAWADAPGGSGGSTTAKASPIRTWAMHAMDPGGSAPNQRGMSLPTIYPKTIGNIIRLTLKGWIKPQGGTGVTVTIRRNWSTVIASTVVSWTSGATAPVEFGPLAVDVVATNLNAMVLDAAILTEDGAFLSENRSLIDLDDTTEFHTTLVAEEYTYPESSSGAATMLDEEPFYIKAPSYIAFSEANRDYATFNPGSILPYVVPESMTLNQPQFEASVPDEPGANFLWTVEGTPSYSPNHNKITFFASVHTSIRLTCKKIVQRDGKGYEDIASKVIYVTHPGTVVQMSGNAWPMVSSNVDRDIDGDPNTNPAAGVLNPRTLIADPLDPSIFYFTDTGCVRKFDGNFTTFAGSTVETGWVDGDSLTARFGTTLTGLAWIGADLYVSDYENHCIRKIDSEGNVTTVAGDRVTGAVVLDTTPLAMHLNHPTDLAVDNYGQLYVRVENTVPMSYFVIVQLDFTNNEAARWFNPSVNYPNTSLTGVAAVGNAIYVSLMDRILQPSVTVESENTRLGPGTAATLVSGGDNTTLDVAQHGYYQDYAGNLGDLGQVVYREICSMSSQSDGTLLVHDNGYIRRVNPNAAPSAQCTTLALGSKSYLGWSRPTVVEGGWHDGSVYFLGSDYLSSLYVVAPGSTITAPLTENLPVPPDQTTPNPLNASSAWAIDETCPIVVDGPGEAYRRVATFGLDPGYDAAWGATAWIPNNVSTPQFQMEMTDEGNIFAAVHHVGDGEPSWLATEQTHPMATARRRVLLHVSVNNSPSKPAPALLMAFVGGSTARENPIAKEFIPHRMFNYDGAGRISDVQYLNTGEFKEAFTYNAQGDVLVHKAIRGPVTTTYYYVYDPQGYLIDIIPNQAP